MYNYKVTDSGKAGKIFEREIHIVFNRADISVRKAGKADERFDRKNYEIKSGAGELGNLGSKLVKGASMVIFAPVVSEAIYVDENGDERCDLNAVEGFVLTRDAFLDGLEQAGALRSKVSTSGTEKVTIQTFWNNAKHAPHGKLLERILDEMYDRCEMTFEEWLGERA
ncbi:MAG: hypothetical protein KBS59_03810 [Clostridiales bacterium]|nr:hypothetical protein [Clostridiales bacterium]